MPSGTPNMGTNKVTGTTKSAASGAPGGSQNQGGAGPSNASRAGSAAAANSRAGASTGNTSRGGAGPSNASRAASAAAANSRAASASTGNTSRGGPSNTSRAASAQAAQARAAANAGPKSGPGGAGGVRNTSGGTVLSSPSKAVTQSRNAGGLLGSTRPAPSMGGLLNQLNQMDRAIVEAGTAFGKRHQMDTGFGIMFGDSRRFNRIDPDVVLGKAPPGVTQAERERALLGISNLQSLYGKPIAITDAMSPRPGRPGSMHVKGNAFDLSVPGGVAEKARVAELAAQLGFGGIGASYADYPNMVHVDTRSMPPAGPTNWGPGGSFATAPQWQRDAIASGFGQEPNWDAVVGNSVAPSLSAAVSSPKMQDRIEAEIDPRGLMANAPRPKDPNLASTAATRNVLAGLGVNPPRAYPGAPAPAYSGAAMANYGIAPSQRGMTTPASTVAGMPEIPGWEGFPAARPSYQNPGRSFANVSGQFPAVGAPEPVSEAQLRNPSSGMAFNPALPNKPAGGMSFTPGLPDNLASGMSFTPGLPRNPISGMAFNPGLPRSPISGMAFNPSPPRNPISGMAFNPGLPRNQTGGMSFNPDLPGDMPPQVAQGIPDQMGRTEPVSTENFADSPFGRALGSFGESIASGFEGLGSAMRQYEENKGLINAPIIGSIAKSQIGKMGNAALGNVISGIQSGITSGVSSLIGAPADEPPQAVAGNYGLAPGAPQPGVYGPSPYMDPSYSFSVPGRPAGTRRDAHLGWGAETALTTGLGLATGVPGAGLATDGLQQLGAMGRQGRLGNNPGGPYTEGADHGHSYDGGTAGGERAVREWAEKQSPRDIQNLQARLEEVLRGYFVQVPGQQYPQYVTAYEPPPGAIPVAA